MSERSSLGYLRPYRKQLTLGVVMLALTNIAYLGVPEMLGNAVDALGVKDQHYILGLVGWMVVFALLTGVHPDRVADLDLQRGARRRVRPALASCSAHLMTLSPAYYRDHPTGDVMSRLTNDVQTVRAMWGAGLLNLANAADRVRHGARPACCWIDRMVTLWAIMPYPLIFVVGQAMSRRIYRTQRDGPGRARRAVVADPGGPRRDPGDQDLRARGGAAQGVPRALASACSTRTWRRRRSASSSARCSTRSPRSASRS